MNALWKRLNLKGESEIVVLRAPQSFGLHLGDLSGVAVRRPLTASRPIGFLLAFVTKESSRRYSSEIARDSGWAPPGTAGFEGVRAVAIDEDWSGPRFRKVEFIRMMKRDPQRALTQKGRARAARGKAS